MSLSTSMDVRRDGARMLTWSDVHALITEQSRANSKPLLTFSSIERDPKDWSFEHKLDTPSKILISNELTPSSPAKPTETSSQKVEEIIYSVPPIPSSPQQIESDKLAEKYSRELRLKLIAKQMKVRAAFDSIQSQCELKFKELSISAERERIKQETRWEEEERENLKLREMKRKELSERHEKLRQERNKALHEQAKAEKERALEAQREMERQEELRQLELKRAQEEARALRTSALSVLDTVLDIQNQIYTTLHDDIFNRAPGFTQKATMAADETVRKCREYIESKLPESKDLSKLDQYVTLIQGLKGRIEEIKEKLRAKFQPIQQPPQQQAQVPTNSAASTQQVAAQNTQQTVSSTQQVAAQSTQQTVSSTGAVPPQPVLPQPSSAAAQQSAPSSQPSQPPAAPFNERGSCAHEDTLKEYFRRNRLIQHVSDQASQLNSSPQLKKLKLELMKVVNSTINSMSRQSGSHLKSKLVTLLTLLSGGTADFSNKAVSTCGEPAALAFVQNTIARKLVEQADSQVSANPSTAFIYSTVIVGLCNHSDILKDLILGYFYIGCPYLIPYYPVRTSDQTPEQFYSSCGYEVSPSGEVEAQTSYVKRITGLCRLHFSCFVSMEAGGGQNKAMSLEHAWMFLVRLLNLQPQPVVTSIVLKNFLEVCGSQMIAVYRKQMWKLIAYIQQIFIPEIRDVTDEQTDGGAFERLCLYVTNIISKRNISEPDGVISRSFWYT